MMKKYSIIVSIVILFLATFSGVAFALEPVEPSPEGSTIENEIKNSEAITKTDAESVQKTEVAKSGSSGGVLSDFEFGIGIGVNRLDSKHVVDAIENNGFIDVRETEKERMQFWLEAHIPLGSKYVQRKCGADGCKVDTVNKDGEDLGPNSIFYTYRKFYHGPFFAVQISDGDSTLSGAAVGYMASFKIPLDSGDDRFFNVGLGLSTSKITTLGGQRDGDQLSEGESINLNSRTERGILLLFSVNAF